MIKNKEQLSNAQWNAIKGREKAPENMGNTVTGNKRYHIGEQKHEGMN